MTSVQEHVRQERDELRRQLRDVLAVAGLFSLWPGRDAAGVAETFAGAALSTLDLDLVCVRFRSASLAAATDVIRAGRPLSAEERRAVTEALQPWVERGSSRRARRSRIPLDRVSCGWRDRHSVTRVWS